MPTDKDSRDKDESELLSEMFTKASYSIATFIFERIIMSLFSFGITSTLGASVYGYISVVIRAEQTFARALGGIITGLLRTIPRVDQNHRRQISTLSLLISLLAWSLGIVVPVVLFKDYIIQNTLLEPRHEILVYLATVAILSSMVLFYSSTVYLAHKNTRVGLFITKILKPLGYMVGAIIALLVLTPAKATAVSIISVVVVLLGVLSIYSVHLVNKKTPLTTSVHIRSEEVWEFLSYSYDASISSFLGLFHRQIVFVLMAVVLSPVAAGLFSLALILASAGRWPLQGINTIFPPIATDLYNAEDMDALDSLYKSSSKVATFFSCIPFIFVLNFHEPIMVVFSAEYASNSIILVVVYIAQIFATLVGSVGLLLMMTDNERPALYINLSNAALMIPISILLTLEFGVIGLTISFLFTMVYNNFIQVAVLKYLEEISPLTKNHIYLVVSVGILALLPMASTYIVGSTGLLAVLTLFCTLLYIVTSYRYLLDQDEKDSLRAVADSIY